MLEVEINIDNIRYGLFHPDYQRHTNFVISKAMNKTLYDIREKQVSKRPFGGFKTYRKKTDDGRITEARRTMNYKPGSGEIDKYIKGNATAWTKRGMLVVGSNKSSLMGHIIFDGPRNYMKWMVFGGTALPNRTVIPEPAKDRSGNYKVKLNAFGGIKGGLGKIKTRTDKSTNLKVKTKIKRDQVNKWVGYPRQRPETPNNFGLWQAFGKGKNRKIKKLVHLQAHTRAQKPQYPADFLARDYFNLRFRNNLLLAFQQATGLKDFSAPPGRRFGGGY
jgi:hypothetical protein